MKKYLFAFLAFSFAVPAAAYDFGTSGIVGALAVAGAALALTFGAPAAMGTIAIGALVAGLEFNPEAATGKTPAIEVQVSPGAKLPTPDGWTPPSGADVEPTAPATVPSTGQAYSMAAQGVTGTYPTQLDACKAYQAQLASWDDPSLYSVANNGCYRLSSFKGTITSTNSCPAGYTYGSGFCNLTSNAAAMKPSDGACTIKRVANSFSADPRDPDCAAGKVPATVAIQPNEITATDSDGKTRAIRINADGSATATETRPNTTNNTTESNTTAFSAPNASGQVKVTGQGSGVAPGTGSQAGSAAPPVVFDKSGLATESTQAGIKADTGAIKDALTGEGVDNSLAAEKGFLDGAMDSIAAMFSGEAAKDSGIEDNFSFAQFLPQACGCTPLTIDYHGHHASFDWCAPMNTIKDALAWALGILTALFVLVQFKVSGGK